MLFPLYEMWGTYHEIPHKEQLVSVDAPLEYVAQHENNTQFTFLIADSALSLTVFDGLHEYLKSRYSDGFNPGDTFSIQFSNGTEPFFTGLRLKEHTLFDFSDYRHFQLQAIKEGPFALFMLCIGAIAIFTVLILLIPTIRRKSTANVKRKLLAISGVSILEANKYRLMVGGYPVELMHRLRIIVSKYGNKNEVIALIEVPVEISTKFYTKLVGRFDTIQEDGQYYVLVTQRINFRLNTKRLLNKIKYQIEALDALGN